MQSLQTQVDEIQRGQRPNNSCTLHTVVRVDEDVFTVYVMLMLGIGFDAKRTQ